MKMSDKTQLELEQLYESYIMKVYGESPATIPSFEDNKLDDKGLNFAWTINKGVKFNKVDQIQYVNTVLSVYEEMYSGKTQHFFIDRAPFTKASFIFKPFNDGIQFLDAWNNWMYARSLCRWLVLNYYLIKYPFVVCDSLHTPEGINYWKKLMTEALKEKHKVVVFNSKIDMEYKIMSAEQLDDYYYIENPGQYLFKIYAK